MPRCRPDSTSAQMPESGRCVLGGGTWILEEILKSFLCFSSNSSCSGFSEQRRGCARRSAPLPPRPQAARAPRRRSPGPPCGVCGSGSFIKHKRGWVMERSGSCERGCRGRGPVKRTCPCLKKEAVGSRRRFGARGVSGALAICPRSSDRASRRVRRGQTSASRPEERHRPLERVPSASVAILPDAPSADRSHARLLRTKQCVPGRVEPEASTFPLRVIAQGSGVGV